MIDTIRALLEMLRPWKLRRLGMEAIARMKAAEASRDAYRLQVKNLSGMLRAADEECALLRNVFVNSLPDPTRLDEPRHPVCKDWVN